VPAHDYKAHPELKRCASYLLNRISRNPPLPAIRQHELDPAFVRLKDAEFSRSVEVVDMEIAFSRPAHRRHNGFNHNGCWSNMRHIQTTAQQSQTDQQHSE